MRATTLLALATILVACTPELVDTTTISGTVTTGSVPAVPGTSSQAVFPAHLERVVESWKTDFSITSIDLDELLVGIPASDPRDMIPPIDAPRFEEAATSIWIDDREPGVMLEIDGDARFYPLSVMTWHEIVNDVVGDVPVAVTYCPLCNTGLVFDRRVSGDT
ncbi:MAG: DUF3179 domain-containing protein, partial [Actinobacteria bacterium]|nr:DUF3179 domain-containing protein [Actinomycetota bacterium]